MRLKVKLAAILAIALLLRTINLPTVPSWDWDESANINYAKNLMEGRAQSFAYKYHFMPHPPLYFLALAVLFKIFGASIIVARYFSVICSLTGLLIVYKIVRKASNEGNALLAGAAYALYPELVFWNRIGYANNLVGVLILASVYFLQRFLEYKRGKDLCYSSMLTGLALLTEYYSIVFLLALCVLLYWHMREHLTKAVTIALAPLVFFAALMLLTDSEGFINDASSNFGRIPLVIPFFVIAAYLFKRFSADALELVKRIYFKASGTPAEVIVLLALTAISVKPLEIHSFYFGGSVSTFFLASFLGIFFIEHQVFRSMILVYAGLYAGLLLAMNRWDHMSIPLHFLLSCFCPFFFGRVKAVMEGKTPWLVITVLAIPFATTMWLDLNAFAFGGIHGFPVNEMHDLSGYVNNRTSADDVIVVGMSHDIEFKARTAMFENFFPYNGYEFSYMRRKYKPEEFVYNLSVDNVAYLVCPEWLFTEIKGDRYDGFGERFRNWSVVYEQSSVSRKDASLGFFKPKDSNVSYNYHYLVLENPLRSGSNQSKERPASA